MVLRFGELFKPSVPIVLNTYDVVAEVRCQLLSGKTDIQVMLDEFVADCN